MDDNDLKRLIDSVVADTRRHFEVVAERTDKKVELLAEAIAALGGGLRLETAELREETRRGFAETHAMINCATIAQKEALAMGDVVFGTGVTEGAVRAIRKGSREDERRNH
ncbi:MAG TPA: hypothetical protein VMT00_12680 [Thermoanaerobaculia bacterium]|nr:hypothetical protein [Thermoanaerobaculia bacterium]